ncbi:heme NO-binding domain-containing protein [Echinicola sp. CAU 1574]|uniref:Heme NO-binding domain-containing protein n=1 Tax=Echinicola arenosa TaxID=2774144 RepID=A0ABR9AMA3_9BACT|nr:heme NO-binding domain-containing protein [Echinicola arenosa]MBD8488973.1 heme NO-binding domain-containing protein [Echinicola arenosa]
MYGIVNKAIEDLIITQYGEESWDNTKEQINLDIDFFLINQVYDDQLTFQLIEAAGNVIGKSQNELLKELGIWWIVKLSKERYGSLMTTGGQDLREFLINLPAFHTRVMMIYPKIQTPEFAITSISRNNIQLLYKSKRAGLVNFVYGMLIGLAKLFSSQVKINITPDPFHPERSALFDILWI